MARNSFKIPWPPSVNSMYINRRGSYKRIRTHEARSYVDTVYALTRQCRPHDDARVKVTMWLYPPDNRKRDIDNILKASLDSLTKAGLWWDDSQIDDIHVMKRNPSKTNPRIEVFSENLTNNPFNSLD